MRSADFLYGANSDHIFDISPLINMRKYSPYFYKSILQLLTILVKAKS